VSELDSAADMPRNQLEDSINVMTAGSMAIKAIDGNRNSKNLVCKILEPKASAVFAIKQFTSRDGLVNLATAAS